jgi:AraC-like DNA-binding protein
MKRVLFCIFSIAIVLSIFAQSSIEDSLLVILPESDGEARLKIIHKLQEQELYQPKSYYYNDLMLEEAEKQKNNKYKSIALTNRVAYHRFAELDTLLHYARIAEDFSSQNKFYKDLFLTKQMIVLHYLGRGYYSLGRGTAQEMYEEAKKIGNKQAMLMSLVALGDAYRWLGQDDESIQYIKEARLLYEPTEEAPYKILECYVGLISAYINKSAESETSLYLDSLRTETPKIKKAYPLYNLADFEIILPLCYAHHYINENCLDEALEKIEEAEKIIKENGEIAYYTFLLNQMKMGYYFVRKDEEKAMYYYDICYTYSKENHLETSIRTLLKFKADFLYGKGWYEEASQAYRNLQAHTDSVNRESYLYEFEQIRMDYELDKREREIIQQKKELNLRFSFNLILGILSVSLLITIAIIWKVLRAIKHKNFLLFNRIKELTQTKMELLAFKETMRLKMDPILSSVSDSQNTLYERVEEYMDTEKPYINSDYGRKNLTADMNTNEVYLSKAIRSAVNMTIQEYINSQRIEYAKILLLQDMNQTIETVAMDAGFTTIRNFYRLFKDAYGMSPSEFRNYVRENYKK